MYPYDEDFLIMAAIENANTSALRQSKTRAPQEVMVEFEIGGPFETVDLATGWIDTLHDGTNRAVFARRIHRLKHEQDGVPITGGQHALLLLKSVPGQFEMLTPVSMPSRHAAGAGLTNGKTAIEGHEIR